MTPRRRLAAAVLSAAALALPLAVVTAAPAQADVRCTIDGFTPRTVEVGLSPKVATFRPQVSGCDTAESWNIEGDDFTFYVYKDAPQESFSPFSNSEAGPVSAVVSVYNGDFEESIRSFTNGFSLKRNTTWDRVNAGPEPVRKGSRITINARLRVADWTNDEYDGYTNRKVHLEARTYTGSYRDVKTVTTGSGGNVSTSVTATGDQCFRFRYYGNSIAGGGASTGDCVAVR